MVGFAFNIGVAMIDIEFMVTFVTAGVADSAAGRIVDLVIEEAIVDGRMLDPRMDF